MSLDLTAVLARADKLIEVFNNTNNNGWNMAVGMAALDSADDVRALVAEILSLRPGAICGHSDRTVLLEGAGLCCALPLGHTQPHDLRILTNDGSTIE